MKIPRALRAGILAAALPLPAAAEIALDTVQDCVARQAAAQTSPTSCVDEAMADCVNIPADAAALASQCFRAARAGWSAGITARMDALRADAPERIAAIAGVEVKYDLIAGLTQCDRMEELALLGDRPLDQVQREADGCAAAAAGIAYVRLLWRSRDLR
ncbi:MAG: hypothetical protein NXH83_16540 [Rhodobacteraceae bacterium]|nr:hypothetical protein [Paracoccaceae bacterium]